MPLALWLAALLAAIALFHALGRGPLTAPVLFDPGSWGEWAAGRDPITIGFAVGRLGVLALAWYLVGATTIGVFARLAQARRLVAVADALSVPVIRRLLQAALGVGLATAAVGTATGGGPGPPPRSSSTVSAEADDRYAQVIAVEAMHSIGAANTAAMTSLGDGGNAPTVMRAVMRPLQDTAAVRHWTVERGQHFWSIAEHVLATAWGRVPADAEIVGYWRRLIDANREQLADTDNPDLIFPGQVFTIPGPPPT